MKDKIAFVLADGFEEIEAVAPIDVLRRLEFEVVVAGLKKTVEGSHGVKVEADCLVGELKGGELAAVVLPGGMPGSVNLRDNPAVISLLKSVHSAGGITAAICAAPIALKKAGLIEGRTITAHPSVKNEFAGATYTENPVEADGRIITGKGPGAAFAFAVEIAAMLGKGAEARELMKAMFVTEK